MKNTKRCFVLFSFYDRTGIENYLEKQAENGWMLDRITALGWQFKRIEKKIKRAVTRGKTEIEIRRIRELVLLKLEKNGYEVTQFCGIPGTGIRAWVGIYWNK